MTGEDGMAGVCGEDVMDELISSDATEPRGGSRIFHMGGLHRHYSYRIKRSPKKVSK